MDALRRGTNLPPGIGRQPRPQGVEKTGAPPAVSAQNTDGIASSVVDTQKLEGSSASQQRNRVSSSRVAGDWLGGSSRAIETLLRAAARQLALTPPPLHTAQGPAVKTTGPQEALIGLSSHYLDPTLSYPDALAQLQAKGIPRFSKLSSTERAHETAFADDVHANVHLFVEGAELLARRDDLDTSIYEVDAMKRLYGAYGQGSEPANTQERLVRAESNHALHPTSVAVARLAFLKKLDELQALPETDPKRRVFVTNGGCAAGKGTLTDIVKRQLGELPFGAVWDAAGEGDALENSWVLEACLHRGLKVVFGFADNDPTRTYADVLVRGAGSGRIVDVLTFTNSYVEGTKNMRAFMTSPAYQQAEASGMAQAFGVFTGRFDVAALEDKSLPEYPDMRTLGKDGLITAADLPRDLDSEVVVKAAIDRLQGYVTEQRAAGKDVDFVVNAALTASLKFLET